MGQIATDIELQITNLDAKLCWTLNHALVIDVGAQDIPAFTIFGPLAPPPLASTAWFIIKLESGGGEGGGREGG